MEECRSQVFGWRIVRFEAARPRPSWIEACRFSLTPISDLIPQNPCRRSDSLPCRLACRACNTPTARLTVMMWRHHYCSHDCMIAAHSSVFAPRTRRRDRLCRWRAECRPRRQARQVFKRVYALTPNTQHSPRLVRPPSPSHRPPLTPSYGVPAFA